MNEKKKERDLLNGPIWPKVLAFALPLALTSMLQQLFNAADIAVVGQFVGKHAMGAVGSVSPIVGLLINLFVGLSVGVNVVISNFTGQRNEKKVAQATHTAILLAVIAGVLMIGIGQLIAAPLVELLGTPPEIAPLAIKYLRIYFCGMPFVTMYNFESAIFRSQGDTRTPLICLFISGTLNVGLNLFFVLVMGMDVDGVAFATMLANVVSSVLLFIFLRHSKGAIRVHWKELRIHRCILETILRIGLPSALQGMVFSLSNMIIQSAINSLGADVVAGSAAAFNIEIFGFFILNSFGQAGVTFVGQNYGAGNLKRCRQVTKQVLIIDEIVTIISAILFILFAHQLLGIFNRDPLVLHYGYIRVVTLMSAEAINVVIEVLSGAMRGYGYSMVPAIVTLVAICGTRIVWVYTIFRQIHTFGNLMAVYPVSWIIAMVIMVFAYFRVRKKVWDKHPEYQG